MLVSLVRIGINTQEGPGRARFDSFYVFEKEKKHKNIFKKKRKILQTILK